MANMSASEWRTGLIIGQQRGGCRAVRLVYQGTFGRIFHLVDGKTKEAFASKEIDLKHLTLAEFECIRREVTCHRKLQHPNIIKYLGDQVTNGFRYLDIELASCSLLDRISKRLSATLCRQFFRHLIEGLEYLHSVGVAHRDICAENLLIGFDGRLKIADFRFAADCLNDVGSGMPADGAEEYKAPEELKVNELYRLEPADVWSCGIVLVEMLTSSLPWSSTESLEYFEWKRYPLTSPFDQMDCEVLYLIKLILEEDPCARATLSDIKKQSWFLKREINL